MIKMTYEEKKRKLKEVIISWEEYNKLKPSEKKMYLELKKYVIPPMSTKEEKIEILISFTKTELNEIGGIPGAFAKLREAEKLAKEKLEEAEEQ